MNTTRPESLESVLWAPHAWVQGMFQSQVLLRINEHGHWSEISPGVTTPPPGATVLEGPLLPGLVNAHSHAFQRAFAGLAERRESASDTFWSWRDRMYGVASRIEPEQLRAVAAQLYIELLRGGYTQVCEFHYLQHAPNGCAYNDPNTLAWALADAAAEAGIGLTLLPVLYERAGFSQFNLRRDQERFSMTADQVWAAHKVFASSGRPLVNAGVAIHSLRAAATQSIHTLTQLAQDMDGPIHIHIAEQTAEVDDCVRATGQRPLQWLVDQGLLDRRWQLVHATHSTAQEIEAIARSGSGAVLCPSTEANLGDGFCDLRGWLSAGVPLSLGSDSHITRSSSEELRWLDYGQRLLHRQRNISAAPEHNQPSTAQRLWQRFLDGGARAAGMQTWGLQTGARADAVVLDVRSSPLLGVPADRYLDAWTFSSPTPPCADVMVGGRWVIRSHQHAGQAAAADQYQEAMTKLWSEPAPVARNSRY